MLKPIAALAALLLASTASAAEPVINEDMQQALEDTGRAMQNSMEQMDKAMQKIMPEVADNMSRMMREVFNSLPPLMSAVERNKVLSRAAEQANQEIENSLQQLQKEVNASADSTENRLHVSGSRNENGRTADYVFSDNAQSLSQVQKLADFLTAPADRKPQKPAISDLKKQPRDAGRFKLEIINGKAFFINDDETLGTFALGNLSDRLNLTVQTSGPDAASRARRFITESQNHLPQ